MRLALRDLVRYQARSGAALAAASLAIGIAATIAITASAEQAHDHTLTGGNLPANQLIVWLANPNDQAGGPGLSVARPGAPAGPPSIPNATVVASARSTADAIAHEAGGGTVVELDSAVDLNTKVPVGAPLAFGEASLVRPITGLPAHQQGWSQVTTPYVATPAVLRFYRIPPPTSPEHRDSHLAPGSQPGTKIGTGFKSDFKPVTIQVSSRLPNYTSAPDTLITPRAMTAGRYTAVPVGWLVQAKQKFTQPKSPTPGTGPPPPGSPPKPAPRRTRPCSSFATTRPESACWSRSAYSR